MARIANPYQGTYAPSAVAGLRMKEIEAGLKAIKVRAPNRKFSSGSYKSGLPKEYEQGK
jgi:hypothetical protein